MNDVWKDISILLAVICVAMALLCHRLGQAVEASTNPQCEWAMRVIMDQEGKDYFPPGP